MRLPHRRAFNVLHHKVVRPFGFADVEDGDDVRVIESGGCPCFLLEPTHALGVLCELNRKELDGNFAIQTIIERQMDFAHAASANQGLDLLVWAKSH